MNEHRQSTISFAEFGLEPAHRQFRRSVKPFALYGKTFDLLTFFSLANNDWEITKDEIPETGWKGYFEAESNLSVQIWAL